MAVMNPCCCSLRLGTQFVAIFNIVCSAIVLLYYVYIRVVFGEEMAAIIVANILGNGACVFTIIMIIALLISIKIEILLLIGAKKRDASKCILWFIITGVVFFIFILYNAAIVILTGLPADKLFAFVIGVLFKFYELWVVYAFVYEIERGGGRQNAAHSGV